MLVYLIKKNLPMLATSVLVFFWLCVAFAQAIDRSF